MSVHDCTEARFSLYEFPAFSCDGPVFPRPDHQDADLRILGADIFVSRNLRIGRFIQFEAEKLQFAASRAPHFRRVFPDSRGEHERVDSSLHGAHRADARLQPMRIDVERQRRAVGMRQGIAQFPALLDGAWSLRGGMSSCSFYLHPITLWL